MAYTEPFTQEGSTVLLPFLQRKKLRLRESQMMCVHLENLRTETMLKGGSLRMPDSTGTKGHFLMKAVSYWEETALILKQKPNVLSACPGPPSAQLDWVL